MTSRQQAIGVFAAGLIALIAVLVFSAFYLGLFSSAVPIVPAPAATPAPQAVAPATPPPPPANVITAPPTDAQIAAALAPKPSDVGIGKPDAPVKWIEYASAGCPHCAEQNQKTFPRIKAAYIDTGKVYYVLRDYPLDSISAGASMLARCLPPSKFYPFMDLVFSKQSDWHSTDVKDPKAAIVGLVKSMGMSDAQAEACFKDQARFDTLKAIAKEAKAVLEIPGTPANFINGELIDGAATFDVLDAKIKAKLGH